MNPRLQRLPRSQQCQHAHGRLAAEPLPGTASIASSLPERTPTLGIGALSYLNISKQLTRYRPTPLETTITWRSPTKKPVQLNKAARAPLTTFEHIQPCGSLTAAAVMRSTPSRAISPAPAVTTAPPRTHVRGRCRRPNSGRFCRPECTAGSAQPQPTTPTSSPTPSCLPSVNEQRYVQQDDGSYTPVRKKFHPKLRYYHPLKMAPRSLEIQMLPEAMGARLKPQAPSPLPDS